MLLRNLLSRKPIIQLRYRTKRRELKEFQMLSYLKEEWGLSTVGLLNLGDEQHSQFRNSRLPLSLRRKDRFTLFKSVHSSFLSSLLYLAQISSSFFPFHGTQVVIIQPSTSHGTTSSPMASIAVA